MTATLSSTSSRNSLTAAVRAITVHALAGGPGAPLPTNSQYQSHYGFTAGTLQRALTHLQERDAVGVTSRGSRGRFIDWVNLREAWHEGSLDPVRLLIPPAGLIETDVIGEVFAETLTRNGIAHAVEHGHGGHTRAMAAATGNTDIAVVSKSTLELMAPGAATNPTGLQRELPLGSFYAPSRVVVVRRAGEGDQRPRTVAIDRNSPDHVVLTQAEFPPQDHAYVDIEFPRTLAWVRTGRVDAAIWHVNTTDVPITLAGFELTPVRATSPAIQGQDSSRAVMVANPARLELAAILREFPVDVLINRQEAQMAAESDRHAEYILP